MAKLSTLVPSEGHKTLLREKNCRITEKLTVVATSESSVTAFVQGAPSGTIQLNACVKVTKKPTADTPLQPGEYY